MYFQRIPFAEGEFETTLVQPLSLDHPGLDDANFTGGTQRLNHLAESHGVHPTLTRLPMFGTCGSLCEEDTVRRGRGLKAADLGLC